MEKKFIGIISYGVYLQPNLVSNGGPWKFPWVKALQLGIGGPVDRSFGLPRPLPCAFAIGIKVIVADKVVIIIPTIAANNTIEQFLFICICIPFLILHYLMFSLVLGPNSNHCNTFEIFITI
jgi:hypothetical protein